MKPYIFEERNGICIINLAKTMQQIRTAVQIVGDVVKDRKSILFVGTKKQAKGVIRECAEDAGEFYVCERWLGGMLTNLATMRHSVKILERIEKKLAAGGEGLTKKEVSLLGKEQVKLDRNLSGIRAMRKTPGLVILVDPSREHIAVKEAKKLGIPVMALVDTNCNPEPIDHVIACNDDALKSVKLILSTLTQEIINQKNILKIAIETEEEAPAKEEMEMAEEAEAKEKEEAPAAEKKTEEESP